MAVRLYVVPCIAYTRIRLLSLLFSHYDNSLPPGRNHFRPLALSPSRRSAGQMPGNKYNGNSVVLTTRVERLLRERELRKSNKASQSNDSVDSNRGTELSEHDLRQREADTSGASLQKYLADARSLNEGWEGHDGRPIRQRLLVVANRLPVSAVRRGEESWSLEISAGGLVSALLGKSLCDYIFFL
nr:alpha,alpha-trehalose-phosphate synthase [UDP-forming] 1-like [Ipomoea batatas]GMC74752.1 alpha,alpha-trehalose-phosphate synthase [UDP-forming] 1-like [Ipomoea batatas]GME09427.1 alpha,alpha-trehalose-phosphate synthase [UDP-forming] 1-like [Ipomoea batatas]GME09431.1 alpha,alpha-trehalose-phosphate synthase [UDP-forming] 1-like [Ipomoea batatas]GME13089.1 alpha,alpha-trehalose-phosphate synthase [UDP-forming] 1-like [Ipomoea batatas]